MPKPLCCETTWAFELIAITIIWVLYHIAPSCLLRILSAANGFILILDLTVPVWGRLPLFLAADIRWVSYP